ncbi:MAG TPA: hypothetical protein DD407_11465 [Pseudohongiella sp.]|nr:hypothetical protein [Gammaproteobacteria bacterium]HBN15646.1 hypothetical protein [Pseudohongiella sp.]
MRDIRVEHRGERDLIARAEAWLKELDAELLKFSRENGLFSALKRGQQDPLPSRTLTWGLPIQKYIIVAVDDLYVLTFKVEVRAWLDDYGMRYSRSNTVARGMSAEELNSMLLPCLEECMALSNSWSQNDLLLVRNG